MNSNPNTVSQEPLSKYVITSRFGYTKLTQQPSGFWSDDKGTLYAYKEASSTTDQEDRCGVWPLALPQWAMFQKINEACVPHDFTYSSPVYQAFHTRTDADYYLDHLLTLEGHPLLGDVFSDIAKLLGVPFWENAKTI